MGSLELWRDSRALEALVRSGLFEDEKAVVDMPLLCPTLGPLSRALQLREGGGARATAVLGSGSSQTGLGAHQEHTTEGGQVAGGGQQEAGQESMRGVVAEFFLPPGADLIQTVPSDFRPDPCLVTSPSLVTATASAPSPPSTTLPAVVTSQPPFLPLVTDPAVRAWALEVHRLWPSLCRRCAPGVAQHPSQHSLLPLPGPFFIPGQRFREMYYWDSYWIVRWGTVLYTTELHHTTLHFTALHFSAVQRTTVQRSMEGSGAMNPQCAQSRDASCLDSSVSCTVPSPES